MGLAFPAMGYSLIDGKTYRQINLKPTGFSKDQGVSMLRYTRPPRGQFAPSRKTQWVNMHRNAIRREISGGQHAPLWHAYTRRMGTWHFRIKGRRWGSVCSAISSCITTKKT